jgi:hypothetical protein
MRFYFVLISCVAAAVGIAAWGGVACAQDKQVAPEGLGQRSTPAQMPATPPEHPFVSEPWGGFSRTLFEADEDPNFKLVIRDFSFPPDRQPHTITLPSAAFLHILGEQAEISIAKQQLALTPAARTVVPAGAPIEVVNNGEFALVVRALIVEAK